MERTDWRSSVVYQIYPRSFCDSNGDGIGDLPGITSKLDHLQRLGVDVVWLSPIYASPQDDNGYDIADYRAIAPEFGTMADFDAMLDAMHQRGMRLMMDLVVNHTSDEHAWFQQARSSRHNPYHDYYLWREPATDGGPPTNWEAAFQGSVWEWNEPTGEYYLHMFSKKQPDLNWENPRVRQEVYALMRFWLDKGVDGFRMDVINMISKPWNPDGSLPNAPVVRDGFLQPGFALTCNGPRLVEFLTEMRTEVLDHYDTLTVGEAPLATVEVGQALTHPKTGALNMLFQFEHMDLDIAPAQAVGKWVTQPLDLRELEQSMARWQNGLHGQGWNSLYLSNHDQPRPVSRWGDDGVHRVAAAKMLATWLHGHQGTPYVYQGEELGMPNYPFTAIDDCRDIESINFYQVATRQLGWTDRQAMAAIRAKGRDNARVPVAWDGTAHGGFTLGTPWIDSHPDAAQFHAQGQYGDTESVFQHYQRLIGLRKRCPVLVHGRYEVLSSGHPRVGVYRRTWGEQCLWVVCNFSAERAVVTVPEAMSSGQTLIGHGAETITPDTSTLTLQPYGALMVLGKD